MSYIGNQPFNASFITDSFSGTGSQTVYNLTVGPGSSNAVLVVISGVLQPPSAYSVIGQVLTFSSPPPSGSNNIVVRYLGLPASSVTNSAYRNYTELTASAGQTTFSPAAYTPGFIDVFRNGVRLHGTDYTASNGTTVVLANAANSGDSVAVVGFYVSSVLNAIPNISGAVTPSNYDASGQSGTGALQLPSGTTGQRPAIPVLGMQRWNSTFGAMEVYVGSNTWQPIAQAIYTVEVLLVAGGGSGGWDVGAGGGAGGLVYVGSTSVNPGTVYNIIVGAGGTPSSGGSGAGGSGNNTTAFGYTAIGGGGGGNWAGGTGLSGGSGGGSTSNMSTPGSGTTGQGYPGGTASSNTANSNEYSGASGGGGAGGPGGSGITSGWSANSSAYGYGGPGLYFSQFATVGGSPAGYFAGGGGSASDGGSFYGVGGLGGGSVGGNNRVNGVTNTGGGGGGAGSVSNVQSGIVSNQGTYGGSGIVIIRYQNTAQRGLGGSVTTSGGYYIHTFNNSATYTA